MISMEFAKSLQLKPEMPYWTWAPIWQSWIMSGVELRCALEDAALRPGWKIEDIEGLVESARLWYSLCYEQKDWTSLELFPPNSTNFLSVDG